MSDPHNTYRNCTHLSKLIVCSGGAWIEGGGEYTAGQKAGMRSVVQNEEEQQKQPAGSKYEGIFSQGRRRAAMEEVEMDDFMTGIYGP